MAQRETLPSTTNVLVLSAKNQNSLDNLVKRYQHFLATTNYDFNDICFTAATCRDHYPYRVAIAAENTRAASQLIKDGAFASFHGKNNSLNAHHDAKLELLISDYLQGKLVDWASYYKTYLSKLTKVQITQLSL